MVMTRDAFMEEACRLAKESVDNGWGGPFGAVITRNGEIVARGQNRVLLTGDPTAHAEVEAIRKAAAVLNPGAPSISPDHVNESILELIPRQAGSPDRVPERAKMLTGHEIYISGTPCPMCMSAIYWSRIDVRQRPRGDLQDRLRRRLPVRGLRQAVLRALRHGRAVPAGPGGGAVQGVGAEGRQAPVLT
jgi:tRNA(Arg) A34 adenosine deaminase TadA